jgi:hypothetical protein
MHGEAASPPAAVAGAGLQTRWWASGDAEVKRFVPREV